mmetsp:Transcript_17938/g.38774  ORF Transcript_17938/g.38774 Transcript_17938/m.38774 type:complete len:162 (-) Transcript_17938:1955-2440(-)
MKKLTLEIADRLANGVINCVKRNKFAPVAVNIVDRQANVLVQKRMDGCIHVGIPEFSYAKAYTCAVTNLASREFRDKYTSDNNPAKFCQMNSMIDISGGKMAAFPGGILLRNNDSEVIGAIGVSGASGDEDEYAGLKSVWDSGLPMQTQPKEHSCTTLREE